MSSSGRWSPAAAQAPAPPAGPGAGTAAQGTALAPPPPPPGSAAAAAPTQGEAPNPAQQNRASLGGSDIPSALARWQVVITAAVIVWALLTAALLGNSFDKTRAGAANTAQLTRIHAMESSLFQADAIATNAFLVGGLEPAEQRTAYDAALDQVTRLIVISAEAQPADRAALAELNRQVLGYAEQMQQARANNRQGLPVGAQYLREASDDLRNDTLNVLTALADANQQRATAAFSGHYWILALLPGIALLLLLGWFNQRLAAIFRRRINVGLALGAGVVALTTIAAAVVLSSLASDADDLRTGDYATASSISAARTAANDAKANESLRLIARGSGAQFEERWQAAAATVSESLADHSNLERLWEDYTTAHLQIVEADADGEWDEAVRLATSTDPDSARDHFIAFDEEAESRIEMASKALSSTLQGGSWRAAVTAVATILAMFAAVAAVSYGITVRRKEFA